MNFAEFGKWLRYVLAGGVGVMWACVTNNELRDRLIALIERKDELSLAAGTAIGAVCLILGAFVYSIHRAVLYPICFRILFRITTLHREYDRGGKLTSCFICPICPVEYMADHLYWRHCSTEGEWKTYRLKLEAWADIMHFLYCTCWVILLTKLFVKTDMSAPSLLQNAQWLDSWPTLIVLWLITLLSNYRLCWYTARLSAEAEPDPGKKPVPSSVADQDKNAGGTAPSSQ